MKHLLIISIFSFGSFLLAQEGEKEKEKSYSEKLKEVYEKGVKGAKEKYEETLGDGKNLTSKSKEWLLKDIENIGDWEYKIVTFGSEKIKDIEMQLNALGRERWQCFWVEQVNDNAKSFYFKRTKMSYLSKIPTGAILRIMADFQNN